jgi:hypothetical protein
MKSAQKAGQPWRCDRCGGLEKNRNGRRKHIKCPLPPAARFHRATIFNDPEARQAIIDMAAAGDAGARKFLKEMPQADADIRDYKEMIETERKRMWALGFYQDGEPAWKCEACGELIEFPATAINAGDYHFCQSHREEAVAKAEEILKSQQQEGEKNEQV